VGGAEVEVWLADVDAPSAGWDCADAADEIVEVEVEVGAYVGCEGDEAAGELL